MAAVPLNEEMEEKDDGGKVRLCLILGLCQFFPTFVVQASWLNVHPCIILDLKKVILKHLLSVKFYIAVVVYREQMSQHLTRNIC